METIDILNQKGIKKIEMRKLLVDAITGGSFSLEEIESASDSLKDKQIATVLEAIEAVSGQKTAVLDVAYLTFAKRFILSENNSCKREPASARHRASSAIWRLTIPTCSATPSLPCCKTPVTAAPSSVGAAPMRLQE